MIFITNKEKPLFGGYVNGIIDVKTSNGGVLKKINLGTSEKKQNGTKEYSSWFAILIGEARKKNEEKPLQKGDYIQINSFKITNVSKKTEDGKYGNPYFNMTIMDYTVKSANNSTTQEDDLDEENPF